MQIPIPERIDVGGRSVQQQPLEAPLQLALPFYGRTIDVDRLRDSQHPDGIEYWGRAQHVFDNVYRCLARVGDALCVVEVSISAPDSKT